MDARKLSNRLLTAAKYVKAGAVLADIGSDHAYLPAYLALNKQIKFGIAGEVVKGPFENAQHEIKKDSFFRHDEPCQRKFHGWQFCNSALSTQWHEIPNGALS